MARVPAKIRRHSPFPARDCSAVFGHASGKSGWDEGIAHRFTDPPRWKFRLEGS